MRKLTLVSALFLLCAPAIVRADAAYVFIKGLDLMDAQKYDDGAAAFSAVLKEDSGNYGARLHLGIAYARMGKLDDSVQELEKAAQANPAGPAAYYVLGMVHEKRKDYAKAKSAWERFIGISGDAEKKKTATEHLKRIEKLISDQAASKKEVK